MSEIDGSVVQIVPWKSVNRGLIDPIGCLQSSDAQTRSQW
jgi:hypothetical protein